MKEKKSKEYILNAIKACEDNPKQIRLEEWKKKLKEYQNLEIELER